tara:strand:- start:1363 stop:1629 length:267 start_codon:yes stop_codon:yes gene_type:complete
MTDIFDTYDSGLDSPAASSFDITPNDTTDLNVATRGLWVGTGGDVAVILVKDSASVIIKNVANGYLLATRIKRVLATGTTATDLVGMV